MTYGRMIEIYVVTALGPIPLATMGPLIKVYLTGKELKTVAEIDASISDYMTTARLYCSGLNMTYNPNRLILNRVTDVYLTKNDKREEIEDDKLYCVVADRKSVV